MGWLAMGAAPGQGRQRAPAASRPSLDLHAGELHTSIPLRQVRLCKYTPGRPGDIQG